jgi:endoglucanase
MDWLLTMQAEDGSVYHKVSTLSFGGFIPANEELTDRFITPWSSAATADFVAMAAKASRAFQPYRSGYARQCLEAARRSYTFLQAHPENHSADLRGFSTGGYQTRDDDDRLWAAAELYETTGEEGYLKDFEARARRYQPLVDPSFGWSDVKDLGMLTYLLSRRPGRDPELVSQVRASLLSAADGIVRTRNAHGYARPLGTTYFWGCNGDVAAQTVLLQAANRMRPNTDYVNTALDALGHLFGRNFHCRSYVTGLGYNPPMHPHDRSSGSDKAEAPWPGYLVGGGHPDGTSWRDEQGRYDLNEIAINWNAPLIYALASFASR